MSWVVLVDTGCDVPDLVGPFANNSEAWDVVDAAHGTTTEVVWMFPDLDTLRAAHEPQEID